MQKAFTLIELLVVVLIIGILSAIALPQYRVAVERAKYQQMVVVADAIVKAQQLYYMENNSYATSADELSIQRPDSDCSLGSAFTQCHLQKKHLMYEVDYTRRYRYCIAVNDNNVANRVCSIETGGATPRFSEEYNVNYYAYP